MGSPDPQQLDGIGGGHPLTSKVAIVGPSTEPDADVDYLFLQVAVDRAQVSTDQTCGNILAGVGPFAIERGLVAPDWRAHPGADPDGQHGRRRRSRTCPRPVVESTTGGDDDQRRAATRRRRSR